ncbi:MAG TPA: DUF3592 domain-containing protein, partial [Planctomycetota bacterium]|nr:DUF3592 domain-containing protein [Planctomycetota bacterium]
MATARKQMSPQGQRIFGGVFALIGALSLLGGSYWFWHTRAFLQSAVTAPGVVVEMVASHGSKSTTYAPVYTFTDAQGGSHKIRSHTSSSPPSYEVGEAVTVYYDPNNPEDTLLDGWFDLWGGATILGGLGAVFFAVGLLVFVAGSKARPAGEPGGTQAVENSADERPAVDAPPAFPKHKLVGGVLVISGLVLFGVGFALFRNQPASQRQPAPAAATSTATTGIS